MLNIGTQNTGNYDNWVKFNGKSGRWSIKGADGNEQEIVPNNFVADLANIKTGWIYFMAGQAPSRVWDKDLSTPAPKPDDNHKRGFGLRLFSNNTFGGVVELSSSSMHLCASITELYSAYSEGVKSNAGMLPVVKFTGVTPQKDKHGTNYKPGFVIEKWVSRPAEFASEAPTPQAQTTVQAAPAPAAAPVQNSVSEF